MHSAVQVLRYVNLVAYVALGAVTCVLWLRRRDRPTRWAAIAFGSLGALELLGLIHSHHGNFLEQVNLRLVIALLVVFPYLLFRFTNAFREPNPKLANGLFILSAVLVVWTFALPRIPTASEHRSTEFTVWLTLFFIHWSVLSVVSAWSLWTAGRAQPTVARRRMQSLALAAAFITFALLLALPRSDQGSWLSLASQCVALISVIAFFLAFAPPQVLRILWRAPEQTRMQQAIASLLAFATSQEEVAGRVLEPAAAIVGARAIAIGNAEGRFVASWNVPDEVKSILGHDETPTLWDDARVVTVAVPDGSTIIVWTSPYAPFFGEEECGCCRRSGRSSGSRSTAFASSRPSTRRASRSSEPIR